MAKNLLIFPILGTVMSSGALAQNVSTQKSVSVPLPNLYGNVYMRHYTFQRYETADKVSRTDPLGHIIAELGGTFYDDKLDISAATRLSKRPQTNKVESHPIEAHVISGSLTLLETPYIDFKPYANARWDADGRTWGDVGFDLTKSFEMNVGIGTLTLTPGIDASGYWYGTRNDDADVTDLFKDLSDEEKQGVSLTQTTDDEGEVAFNKQQDYATYDVVYSAGSSLALKAVDGLSVGFKIELEENYAPEYKLNEEKTDAEFDKYKVSHRTVHTYTVGYQINDRVSLQNKLYHFIGGIYENGARREDRPDNYRFLNRLALNVSLF